MKKIFSLLLVVSPFVLWSQTFSNFQLLNEHVYYVKVFELPGRGQDSLMQQLGLFLPQVPYVSNVRALEDGFTGSISNMKIDYPTALYLHDLVNANFIVQVKEGKYRLIVKDVHLSNDDNIMDDNNSIKDFSKLVTRRPNVKEPRREFANTWVARESMEQLHLELAENFELQNELFSDDW